MDLQDELEELQNIIDTLEMLRSETKDEGNKSVIQNTLSVFYPEYNELYDRIKEEDEKELASMNYEFEISRL